MTSGRVPLDKNCDDGIFKSVSRMWMSENSSRAKDKERTLGEVEECMYGVKQRCREDNLR